MHTSLAGPVEATASRRRGSTDNSIGLDYQSTRPVDEDILSRIRALLLSRNGHHPPSTPHTSEEKPNSAPRDTKPTRFDFSTAKSIARLARKANIKVKPGITRSLSRSADMMCDRRPSQPMLPTTELRRPLLRTSSSVNDFRAPYSDDSARKTDAAFSPSCTSTDPTKTSWIPKLLLQDAKKQDKYNSSHIEMSKYDPRNDLKLRQDELTRCHPPVPSNQSKHLVANSTWPGRELMAEPADLVCFLAGCSPGHLKCKKQHRLPSIPPRKPSEEISIQEDSKSRTATWARRSAKYNHSAANSHASKATTPQGQPNVDAPRPTIAFEDPGEGVIKTSRKKQSYNSESSPWYRITSSDKRPLAIQSIDTAASNDHSKLLSVSAGADFSLSSPIAKVSLNDTSKLTSRLSRTLPGPTLNCVPWRELVENPKLSTNDGAEEIKTPIEFPASERNGHYLRDDYIANDEFKTITSKQSDGSLKHMRPKSPSLLTVASKSSAFRHLLLKPLISVVQPVDTGLPVPPILTTTLGLSDISTTLQEPLPRVPKNPAAWNINELSNATNTMETLAKEEQAETLNGNELVIITESVDTTQRVCHELERESVNQADGDSSNMHDISIIHSFCQKEAQLSQIIKERTYEAKQRLHTSLANDGVNSSLDHLSNSQNPINDFSKSKRDSLPADANRSALISPTPSSQAVYWGFEPTVKELVHNAVNSAMKNVANEALLPKGPGKEKAVRAYRRLFADSLADAAKDVDVYLRRPSLWKEPEPSLPHEKMSLKPCHRLTCLDDPHIEPCVFSCETELNPTPLVSKYTWRGNDCKVCPRPPDTVLAGSIPDVPGTETKIPEDLASQLTRESAGDAITENQGKYRKISRTTRKDSASSLTGIPDRGSSIHKGLNLENPGTNFDHESDNDSLSFLPPNQRLGRKNTVHWLRQLLSASGPYEPMLTALPPRTQRGQYSSYTRIRSQTAPSTPVKQLFLGATPNTVSTNLAEEIPTKPLQKQSALISDGLAKTIHELEDLLNEALVIAKKAADRRELRSYKKITVNHAKERQKLRPRAARHSDEVSDMDSIHESLRSYSGSTDGSDDIREEVSQADAQDQVRAARIGKEKKTISQAQQSGSSRPWSILTSYLPNTRPLFKNPVAVDNAQREQVNTLSRESKNAAIVRKFDPRLKSIGLNQGGVAQKSPNSAAGKETPIKFRNLEPFKGSRLSVNWSATDSYSPGHLSTSKTPGESVATPQAVDQSGPIVPVPLPKISPHAAVPVCRRDHSEDDHNTLSQRLAGTSVPTKSELPDYILEFRRPLIHQRKSSRYLRKGDEQTQKKTQPGNQMVSKSKPIGKTFSWHHIDENEIASCSLPVTEPIPQSRNLPSQEMRQMRTPYSHSLDGTQLTRSEENDFIHGYGQREHGQPGGQPGGKIGRSDTTIIREREIELRDVPSPNLPVTNTSSRHRHHLFNLKNKRHVSLRDHKRFSLARSHKRQSIARDWSPSRKRFCASVACISTALVGILVGIYAGETPAIQYWIVDFHHYTVLGNVFFFIGLSIPTFVFWPLPLLHGRKPYILGAISLAMPLLFPQALAVGELRSPYTPVWRVALILPRAFMGFCLGFANMNFKGILTDLFGASLQSSNPHQEHVDKFDVRRHGGGMGVWLGLWTWSAMGSIGVGFLIGAAIINNLNPAWGFYISITIIAFVLLLNILTPEVRRSAFRRSVAEVKNGSTISRRLARGEVKMHMVQTGPKWWGEEFNYGLMLSIKMLKQPGFMVMAVYVAWMYGQIVLVVLLLGSLCSNSYKFKSPQVGVAVAAVPLGAFIAIPFQKASLFSRDRSHAPISDDETYKKKVKWTSHLIRRAIFVLTLPFAGLGYTLSSGGPPIPFILPILFAALIGFLSNLAMAECHGIIMETYDTSDLQPGMTGRNRGSAGGKSASKRTNYSSFPRVSSAFGITQGLGYLIAAAASGVGGTLTRNLGQQAATGIMAFILLVLSVLLLGVLIRFKDVQIIPHGKKEEMDRYHNARRTPNNRREDGMDEEEHWRPIIIGNPHHSTRRMCILELGSMSRFSEIRRENHLVDEQSLEARHPNHQMMIDVKTKLKEKESEVVRSVRRSLSRQSSLGSRRSVFSDESASGIAEQGDLGGHREIETLESGNGGRHSRRSKRRQATGFQE